MSAADPHGRRKALMRSISKSDHEMKASLRRSTLMLPDSGNNVVNFRAGFSIGFGPSAANSKDEELERLVHSVSQALVDSKSSYGSKGDTRYKIADVEFEPNGCTWTATAIPHDVDETFTIKLDCSEVIEDSDPEENLSDSKEFKRHYEVNMSRSSVRFDPGKAKEIFQLISLDVRKSIVRLDLPEFPEGCKGKVFREIYQLNARVSFDSRQLKYQSTEPSESYHHALIIFLQISI